MKRLLFIGHDASRSGAPAVLLNFLKWLKVNRPDLSFDVLLLDGGPLLTDFEAITEVTVLSSNRAPGILPKILQKLKIWSRFRSLEFTNDLSNHEAFVANTVLSLDLCIQLKRRGAKAIGWIHELDGVIDALFSRRRFKVLADEMDTIIAGSKAVEATLCKRGVTSRISVVYEPQPSSYAGTGEPGFRRVHSIPDDAFVVAGCGSLSHRKGADIFLRSALALCARHNDIYFVWIGGEPRVKERGRTTIRKLRREAEKTTKVIFTGEVVSVENALAEVDVFALCSREDPFPLVNLIAADQAKPIVCFDGAGGTPEFVGKDAGTVVPFLDVAAFCNSIDEYYLDRDLTRVRGQNAREKRSVEFSFEASCKKLAAEIDKLISDPSP